MTRPLQRNWLLILTGAFLILCGTSYQSDAYTRKLVTKEEAKTIILQELAKQKTSRTTRKSGSIPQEYLGIFRRLYKTLGQLVYKKEKKVEAVAKAKTKTKTKETPLVCDPGYEKTYSFGPLWSCAPCKAGTYSKTGYGSCLPCPEGQYSSKSKSSQCQKCPSGTTSVKGSASCKRK